MTARLSRSEAPAYSAGRRAGFLRIALSPGCWKILLEAWPL